jgi:hypothetical protein
MAETGLPVTWEEILTLARRLEDAASDGHVAPQDGAKLVRLVLDFQDKVSGPSSTRRRVASSGPLHGGDTSER